MRSNRRPCGRSAIALAFALSACAAPEKQPPDAHTELDAVCRGYGFKPGTDAYGKCLTTLDQAKRRVGGSGLCVVTSGTVVCY